MRNHNAVTGLKACPECGANEAEQAEISINGSGCVYCPVCQFGVGREAWQGGVAAARRAWNSGDFEYDDE